MSNSIDCSRRFEAGFVTVTPHAIEVLDPADIRSSLSRHLKCDWGLVSECDRLENEFSLDKPLRLFSVYKDSKGHRFWIITEADRSQTTILLPEEY